jgi:hypothetical protein
MTKVIHTFVQVEIKRYFAEQIDIKLECPNVNAGCQMLIPIVYQKIELSA